MVKEEESVIWIAKHTAGAKGIHLCLFRYFLIHTLYIPLGLIFIQVKSNLVVRFLFLSEQQTVLTMVRQQGWSALVAWVYSVSASSVRVNLFLKLLIGLC
jgi:hypothetical protein